MLVIFDIDGTLIDSLEAWLRANDDALKKKGRTLSEDEIISDLFFHHEKGFKKHGISDAKEFYRLRDETLGLHLNSAKEMAHAKEALQQLKSMGHRIGILTSRSKSVAKHALPEWLIAATDIFIDREDAPGKPLPDGLFLASKKSGIPLAQTIFVGDHVTDWECAKAAGVPFIYFRQQQERFSRNFAPNSPAFSDFRELPALIGKISHQS